MNNYDNAGYMRKILYISFIFISVPFSISAVEIENVYWGTAEWEGYTDKDGSGIYTQIFKKIFTMMGVEDEKNNFNIFS